VRVAATQYEIPEAFAELFEPARYKVYYGGRGSGKSWNFARALLLQGIQRPLMIVCARETQTSIRDSVHRLLEDQIGEMGLQSDYRVEKSRIYGQNGTEFAFVGIKSNPDALKSMEGCDRLWVEEAHSVSADSWRKVIPTIRKDGSEIWVGFNPQLVEDETYQRFVVKPPPGAIVRKVSWRDNPWINQVLLDEMAHLRTVDPAQYEHVYEGHCIATITGAVYEREIAVAETEGRIGQVPLIHGKPVHTYWDIGWNDSTAVWFAQSEFGGFRLIDYAEFRFTSIPDIVRDLQSRGYIYGTDWLPHDAFHGTLAAGGRSVEAQLRGFGRTVRAIPRVALVADRLNAARTIFPMCHFDRAKCSDGLYWLRRYRWAESKTGMVRREPLHDEASHASDAFGGLALAIQAPQVQKQRFHMSGSIGHDGTWV
jgi:phage terminase large subunit